MRYELPPSLDDDDHLWDELRGDPTTRDANERLLFGHLRAIGRYAPRRYRDRLADLTPAERRQMVEQATRRLMVRAKQDAEAERPSVT